MDKNVKLRMEDFDLIQIVAMDLNGIPRGEVLPKSVASQIVNHGVEMCGVLHCIGSACDFPMSVPEVMHSSFSNALVIPIMDTLVELPWVSRPGRRVGQVLCRFILDNGQPEITDIRHRVDMQIKRLAMMGYTIKSSFTCQFTTFKSGSEYKHLLGEDKSCLTSPYAFLGNEELFMDLCDQLRSAGVEVESWTSKHGPGAFEISLLPREGLTPADMACRLKHGVKSVMARQGYEATFMTQPPSPDKDAFSAFHFRFTACSAASHNVFLDNSKKDRLSDLARHWIAGLIHHGAGITALCCPTVNCYQRLKDQDTAPTRLDWDIDSSASFLSVHVTRNDVWIENRMPSAACNPFFVLLATIASGLDGIEKKMACPDPSCPDAVPVPCSLGTALGFLKDDKVLEEALSPIMMNVFLSIKGESEVDKFKKLEEEAEDKEQKIADLEKHLYLTRI